MKRILIPVLAALASILFCVPVLASSVQATHSLTIYYQYEDGSQALEAYYGAYTEGQSFQVFTPLIEGYAPSNPNVTGIMGDANLTYTVIFKPTKESGNSSSSSIENIYPSASDSVFGSLGDDFFDEGDFVAFDEESLSSSSELFRNSVGSITNVALYGMILVIGVFAVFEIVHKIAA